MNKWPPLFVLAVTLASLSPACATVSLSVEYAQIFQADGRSGIAAGRIGILVADEGKTSGFVDPFNTALSVGSYLGGTSDDRIIALTTSVANVAGTGLSGFQKFFSSIAYDGSFGAGDNLALMWFPTLSTEGARVGAGVSYGIYRNDFANLASGATIGFVAPADGSTEDMSAYLGSFRAGSGVSNADFTASRVTAVPEPPAGVLASLLVLVLALIPRGRRGRLARS